MYKVYTRKDTPTLIDVTNNEMEVVETMGDYLSEDPEQRFTVIKRENGTDDPYISIFNMNDYLDYKESVELKQKSCVELKKGIVKSAKVKVLRKK